uniref:Uncharacterized protein n=1 Tax=Magallana gigas TaxID=29159 RepID=A0A8W8KUS6_MAGGI
MLFIRRSSQQSPGAIYGASFGASAENILLNEYLNNLCLVNGVYQQCDRVDKERKKLLLLFIFYLLCIPWQSSTPIIVEIMDTIIPGPNPGPDPGPGPGPGPN